MPFGRHIQHKEDFLMKKTLIVLCCTILLFAGLFVFKLTAQPHLAGTPTQHAINPWDSARTKETKLLIAKAHDSANAIKHLPGITDANVLVHSAWKRNVWAKSQNSYVTVCVDTSGNNPIDMDIVRMIGRIIASKFGITDMEDIHVVDTKYHRIYDGAGGIYSEPPTASVQSTTNHPCADTVGGSRTHTKNDTKIRKTKKKEMEKRGKREHCKKS